MGDEISRRNFAALAAAGVSVGAGLSACAEYGSGETANSGKNASARFGGGDSWGEHPDKKGKNHLPQTGNGKVEFKPKYLCLVYLKFDGAKLVAQHAYFPFLANDKEFATKTLSKFGSNGWPAGAEKPSKDFENFNFGSQQRIYFFVDNSTDVIFDEKFLITFTKFGVKTGRPRWDNSIPPVLSAPNPMNENHAFFDATIIEPNLLSLDNWFTKKNKKIIEKGDPDETYSMNIHLKMTTAAGGTIPIVIDPDTGNGAGNEP